MIMERDQMMNPIRFLLPAIAILILSVSVAAAQTPGDLADADQILSPVQLRMKPQAGDEQFFQT